MPHDDPFVLCVEDDPQSREVLQVMLHQVMGFSRLELLADSRHFADRVAMLQEKPSLVLLDIQVKPLDGYGMLEVLRQHPGWQDVCVVALTANVMQNQVERMKQAGFAGLISKPIMRKKFPELLHKILAGESIWYVS